MNDTAAATRPQHPASAADIAGTTNGTAPSARDPFTASSAARDERDRIAALSAEVSVLGDELVMENPDDLPRSIRSLLTSDDRHFWPMLEPVRRVAMVRRAHRRALQAADRSLQRHLRQDTCGNYIDLLCQLIHTSRKEIGDEAYEELRARYLSAKDAWENMRRSPRTKPNARSARELRDEPDSAGFDDRDTSEFLER